MYKVGSNPDVSAVANANNIKMEIYSTLRMFTSARKINLS